MREDDDEIGHYVRLWSRIVILCAVIIAVPVILWTITTFGRNQSKLSTLLATASINTPGRTTIAEPTQQQSTPRQASDLQEAKHRRERRPKTRWSLAIRRTRHRPHRAWRRWLIRRAPPPPRQWLQREPTVCSRP